MNVDLAEAPDGNALRRAAAAVLLERAAEKRRLGQDRQELADRLEEVRENCKTMHGFIREAWHVLEPRTEFEDNWHIGAICEHLEAVNRKEIPLLQINQPPGTMKSMTVSVMFNPWEWGPCNEPGLRYLTASYREDLTVRDSRKSRDLIKSEWYQTLWPSVQLTRTGDSEFTNTYHGRRKALAFMSLTGDRGNRVIVDDPHSVKQADSEQERPATVQLFRESVGSRINDPKRDAIIVMMQRMHPQDVCGVIEELGLPVVRLILPMEYVRSMTVKTPYFEDPRTKENELLHPSRHPREKLDQDKILLGPHAYDTQYQQQPRARDGAYFFSRANILNEVNGELLPAPMPEKCDGIIAIMDTATKTGKKRDGTGTGWFAFSQYPKPHGFILDWDLRQVEADLLIHWLPEVLKRGETLARQCKARSGFLGVMIEDKDSGQILLQQAQRLKLRAQPISGILTSMGKEGRAISASGYVYSGMMKMTTEAFDKSQVYKGRAANHMLTQVTEFRVGHGTPLDEDEMFDCFTYAVNLFFGEAKDARK